jgi:hypothetical protein
MAAIAYPVGLSEVRVRKPVPMRLVAPLEGRAQPSAVSSERSARDAVGVRGARDVEKMRRGLVHKLRAALPGLFVLFLLAALWIGAGALTAGRANALLPLSGAKAVPGGYAYVVRPGDTYWGVATRVDPTGDVRPLVAELEAEVHSSVLTPGTTLVVP